jgi:dipeptidyl aminopeptidase/acylaminoacyl peptidase
VGGSDLRELMRGYAPGGDEPEPSPAPRRWGVWVAIVAALVVLAAATALVVWHRARDRASTRGAGGPALSLPVCRLGAMVGYAYAWSPDGESIAYFAPSDQGDNPVLWRVAPNGKRRRRVRADMRLPYRLGGNAAPARIGLSWGPHGTQLACGPALPLSGRVWTLDLDSRLTWDLGLSYAAPPGWSPDGGELAFVQREFDSANRRVALTLRLISADGTEEREIGRIYQWPPRPVRQGPVWSLDGQRIIVPWDRAPKTGTAPPRQGPVVDAWLVDRNGSDPRPLATAWDCEFANDGGRRIRCEYTAQCWSPDGAHVVVAAFDESDDGRPLGLFRISMLTARAERLLPEPSGTQCLPEGAASRYPTWSPEGDRIAFVAKDTLYVVDVEHADCRPVNTPNSVLPAPPLWSPNGDRILYASSADAKSPAHLCVASLAD